MTGRAARAAALCALIGVVPMASANAQVRFERTGYRLTSIGERMAVSARVVDSRRRPVANARIRWHIADSSIASVTPAGVVVSRKPGYTKLWAVAGGDSASALILVDQWAAKFDFSPSIVRFDAVGSRMPLKVQVRDAAGHLIDQRGRGATCRSVNDRIARLGPNGEIMARTNGVTYVRCTDRGIADSVRVEVRQRPARVIIADKVNLLTKVVGDTFQLRLSAVDRVGDEVRDVQATWVSLNTNVLSVDPLTGKARAIAPSASPIKVIAQVGDVTDTVSIGVNPPAGMSMALADTATGLPSLDAPRTPTLTLQSLYMIVGDTGRITAQAKDASGNSIANPGLIYHSSDTAIVSPISTRSGQAWIAKQTGITYIVAQFGTVVDSLQVSVRAKGATSTSLAGSAAAVAFERPRFDTAAARTAYAARLDSAARAIRRASVIRDLGGRMLSLSAVAGQAAHATSLDSATRAVVEQRTGLMYGGRAELVPLRWLMMSADFRLGELASSSEVGEALTITELQGDLMIAPAQWFSFGGGYVKRAERTELSTQLWEFPRVTAATRLTFVGGAVTTVTALSMMPGATFTGVKGARADAFSLAGEAGLEVRTGILAASVTYYVERFSFPMTAGVERKDQFSMLRLKLGLQAGR